MYNVVTFVRGRCGLKNGTTARPLRREASRVIRWEHPDAERGTKALGTLAPFDVCPFSILRKRRNKVNERLLLEYA